MMNKDEAVQKLATAGRLSIAHAEDLYDSFFPKPVVPGFIAEWIEEAKNKQGYNVVGAVNNAPSGDVEKWLILENVEIFTKAWVYGYEVEKEPRYVVRIKGVDGYATHLNENLDNHEWFFASNERIDGFRVRHTRKELEDADFGWVFFCEGVEVKEVDDGND
ncbi:DUF1642 domain-containing protein [Streptococcus salivarius]|uniref:DUF1642 domain-containing protein n=1 Tax=Streptococcus salivarius TaxID=1304 RepID=UPI000A6A6371|nr:DUF1642 domain-containing protein [Streptococcus salivarius]